MILNVVFKTHLIYNLNMHLQQIFGERVRDFRIQKGLTQEKLSLLCGLDRPQISKIEQGKLNITLDTVEKISLALKEEATTLLLKDEVVRPFVKWAGGKGQLLEKLETYKPKSFLKYFEPFIGGGSFFFKLAPSIAVINDSNEQLMFAYECFKNKESFENLKKELRCMEEKHSEEFYYEIRAMDQDKGFDSLPIYKKAARMIYLNKACFNGLYRVNSKGFFNVPFGKKAKVKTFDEDNFNRIYNYFATHEVKILSTDFVDAVRDVKANDFVYFDPPYDQPENKHSFTAYSKNDFGKEQQALLAEVFKDLDKRGAFVMASNHNTPFISEIYKGYNLHLVEAKRMINSNPNGRGNVEELIITNY